MRKNHTNMLFRTLLLTMIAGVCVFVFSTDRVSAESGLKVNLSGKAYYNSKVTLTWNNPSAADGYEVYKNGKKIKTIRAPKSKTVKYRVVHLKGKTRYKFCVVPYRISEEKKEYGSRSNILSIKTKWRKPRLLMVDKKGNNPGLPQEMKKLGCKVTIVNRLNKVDPKKYDALLVPGGGDVHPKNWGGKKHPAAGNFTYKKDRFQIVAIQRFARAKKPILGICRGEQLINVAFGGAMIQNLYPKSKRPTYEHGFRRVANVKGSWIYKIYGKKPRVFFYHHQAVDPKRLGKGIVITSWSVGHKYKHVEAIEHETLPIYGVQWHPDSNVRKQGTRIFRGFKKVVLWNMSK